jgi:hypothetical protein
MLYNDFIENLKYSYAQTCSDKVLLSNMNTDFLFFISRSRTNIISGYENPTLKMGDAFYKIEHKTNNGVTAQMFVENILNIPEYIYDKFKFEFPKMNIFAITLIHSKDGRDKLICQFNEQDSDIFVLRNFTWYTNNVITYDGSSILKEEPFPPSI